MHRFLALVKGLPWRRIGYAAAAAVWSTGWGLGSAVVYCRHALKGYATHAEVSIQAEFPPKTDYVTAQNFYLVNQKGELVAWLDADGFNWSKGNTVVSFDVNGIGVGREKSSVYTGFNLDGEPFMEFDDSAGKESLVVGSARTNVMQTGEKRTAPVATITFFGKDGLVTKEIQ